MLHSFTLARFAHDSSMRLPVPFDYETSLKPLNSFGFSLSSNAGDDYYSGSVASYRCKTSGVEESMLDYQTSE